MPQTIAQWRYSGKVVQLAFIFRELGWDARCAKTALIAASAASRFTRQHCGAPPRNGKMLPRPFARPAAETISVMLAVFARIEPALRKSITFDNDTVFAQHALLRTMRAMTTWFRDAYASWQKGGVENANGRLRRWLPLNLTSTKCPTRKSRTSSLPPISRPENAWASRLLSGAAHQATP